VNTVRDPVELLLSFLASPRREEVAAIPDLAAVIGAQHAAAASAWPAFTLPRDRYLEALARRIADRATERAAHVVASMPAADLYLAAACSAGDPDALAAFRDAHVPAMRAALGKLGMPPATIDETVQRVLVAVFVGTDRPAQIAEYGGRGTLRSWLRTIAVRTGRRLLGLESAEPSGDEELAELPAAVADPELEMLRTRYRDQVRRAFAAAFAELSERDRNVLRQYHIDGLTIDQLAALYQVNRATTARWVAGARLAVVAGTRKQLVDHLGIATTEVDSIIRLVRSQLDVSVREIAV
jgi:RNA polymerase sigma-70 factor (ECF subfamily)